MADQEILIFQDFALGCSIRFSVQNGQDSTNLAKKRYKYYTVNWVINTLKAFKCLVYQVYFQELTHYMCHETVKKKKMGKKATHIVCNSVPSTDRQISPERGEKVLPLWVYS